MNWQGFGPALAEALASDEIEIDGVVVMYVDGSPDARRVRVMATRNDTPASVTKTLDAPDVSAAAATFASDLLASFE